MRHDHLASMGDVLGAFKPATVRGRDRRPMMAALIAVATGLAWAAPGRAGQAPAPTATPPASVWGGPAFTLPPAIVRASAEPTPGEKGDVIVLLDDTAFTIEADGREAKTDHLVFRVNTTAGLEDWATLEAEWAPWHQERPSIRARVITADGVEHTLDPHTIAEAGVAERDPATYGDRRVLRAPLPAVGIGAVVEEEVTVRDTAPFFLGGTEHTIAIGREVPLRESHVVIDAPLAIPLRYVTRLLSGEPERTESNGRVRLVFSYRSREPFGDIETGMPPETPRVPYVAFSTGPSWSAVAARYAEIVDRQIKGADVARLVSKAPRGGDVKRLAEALLAELRRQLRYTGIEFGSSSIVPWPPAEALKRKFGDCKEQAALLVAMLRAAGVPAHVALLSAGQGKDVEEDLPGLGQFNHAIVVLPGPPALWVDPVGEYSRVGELPYSDQGRLALVCAPSTKGLIRTPEPVSADNRTVETREFTLAESGPAHVTETTEVFGSPERRYRSSYARADTSEQRKWLESYVSNVYLGQLGELGMTPPENLALPFRIHIEANKAKRGFTDTENAIVAIPLGSAISDLPRELTDEKAEKRKNGYVFSPPFVKEIRYHIAPPPGFDARPLPEGGTVAVGPAVMTKEFAIDAHGVVTAVLRFDTGRWRISADEYEALRNALMELQKAPMIQIAFDQEGEAELAAGHVREALAQFAALEKLHPAEASHHTQTARALLAAGMGEEARAAARRAIAVEPGSALAYRTLGWILQHDLVGRRFRPGFDREGAVAAYRKAKELDSTDAVARADLAILLEHDNRGIRYADRGQVSLAVDEYRSLKDDLKTEDMDVNLMIALTYSLRMKELKEMAEKAAPSDRANASILVAIAALDGADAALAEAQRRFPVVQARRAALANAVPLLVTARLYEEAASLLAEASRGAANAAAEKSRIELFRRARRYDEVPQPPDDPASVARAYLIASYVGDEAGESVLAVYTRATAATKRVPRKDAPSAGESVRSLHRSLAASGVPLEAITDLALAGMQVTLDGDDRRGFRARMRTEAGSGSESLFFVVREDGAYRLLALGDELEFLGREALRRAGDHDLEGARTLLDWAREEVKSYGGDDPLAGPAFPRFWTKGAQAGEAETRAAAASLMAPTELADEAIPVLLEGQKEAADESARTRFDLALSFAYLRAQRAAELSPLARRLLATYPTSARAFFLTTAALHLQRRWDEARALVDERLARLPDDSDALRELGMLQEIKGDFVGAQKTQLRRLELGHADSGTYNELAWDALLRGVADDEAIAWAQRGAELSGQKGYGVLHTLASLFAEAGKSTEAYQTIVQAMDSIDREEPEPTDWYVFGRLAENYGLSEAARTYYSRVPVPEAGEPEVVSTHFLATRRLAALLPAGRAGRKPR